MNELQLSELQEKLGYTFKKPSLLKYALTHSSYANENKKIVRASNERLEFLGDSVLGMTVAAMIYGMEPELPEGKMTKLRAELVCERNLASLASELGIGECLSLGKGEEKGGGRCRPSILADAFEAVLAAIYLDGGLEAAQQLVAGYFVPQSSQTAKAISDYKTALQEMVQEKAGRTLSYGVTGESGPDHMKTFDVEVRINDVRIGTGTGRTKKEAEQEAAKAALEKLREES